MHKRANLLSLEQRRTLQLLHLMFIHKDNADNLRIPERNTRAAQRDQFYVERFSTIQFKNNPFYKGSELWKLPPIDIVSMDSMCFSFFYFTIILYIYPVYHWKTRGNPDVIDSQ